MYENSIRDNFSPVYDMADILGIFVPTFLPRIVYICVHNYLDTSVHNIEN